MSFVKTPKPSDEMDDSVTSHTQPEFQDIAIDELSTREIAPRTKPAEDDVILVDLEMQSKAPKEEDPQRCMPIKVAAFALIGCAVVFGAIFVVAQMRENNEEMFSDDLGS